MEAKRATGGDFDQYTYEIAKELKHQMK